ncbi:hypothetical protein QVD17_29546 [Tagetes erecta]|uniref:Transmembrane protein n=1 Tax=Tagetes erecta TaxID=13708 RepID=A0AAD8K2G3_TARER|nr:hypothetical protein QVD17_29546 [Tagetes erecta]
MNGEGNAIQEVKCAKFDFVQKSQLVNYYLHILKMECFDHENWDIILNCLTRSGWIKRQRWNKGGKNGSLIDWWIRKHWNGLIWIVTYWAAEGLMLKIVCNNGWIRIRLYWYGPNGVILFWAIWNKWVHEDQIWYIVGYWMGCVWYGLGCSKKNWAAFVSKLFEGFKWHFFLGRLWSRKLCIVVLFLVFKCMNMFVFLGMCLSWPKRLDNTLP